MIRLLRAWAAACVFCAVHSSVSRGQSALLASIDSDAMIASAFTLTPEHWISSVAMSDDASLVAIGGQGVVSEWDIHTHLFRRSYQPEDLNREPVSRLLYSPSGRLLVGMAPSHIHIWNTSTGRVVHRIETARYRRGNAPLAFSPDESVLAMRVEWGVLLIDVTTGSIRTFGDVWGGDGALTYNRAGTRLLIGMRDSYDIMPIEGDTIRRPFTTVRFPSRLDHMPYIAFSFDGKSLLRGIPSDMRSNQSEIVHEGQTPIRFSAVKAVFTDDDRWIIAQIDNRQVNLVNRSGRTVVSLQPTPQCRCSGGITALGSSEGGHRIATAFTVYPIDENNYQAAGASSVLVNVWYIPLDTSIFGQHTGIADRMKVKDEFETSEGAAQRISQVKGEYVALMDNYLVQWRSRIASERRRTVIPASRIAFGRYDADRQLLDLTVAGSAARIAITPAEARHLQVSASTLVVEADEQPFAPGSAARRLFNQQLVDRASGKRYPIGPQLP